ncbi:hypothetical protein BDV97DRAFT_82007 [Delphinella strobiligena]|nr:hypothetical protein BDV97DRAFT_82007 [Delphinella strobiligena]
MLHATTSNWLFQQSVRHTSQKMSEKCKICRYKKASGKKIKSFPFLELPPELRNKIYGYCLIDPDDIILMSKDKNFRRTVVRTDSKTFHDTVSPKTRLDHGAYAQKGPRQELRPAILAACKQTYGEASPLLYGQTIHVDDTMTLHTFIAGTSHKDRLLLRKIVVHYWGMGRGTHKAMNHAALTLLASCTNLERVFFACQIHWGSYNRSENATKFMARQLYRNGFHFLEAIGAARGNQDAGIDVVDIHDNHFSHIPGGVSKGLPDENQKQAARETNKREFRDELKKLLHR